MRSNSCHEHNTTSNGSGIKNGLAPRLTTTRIRCTLREVRGVTLAITFLLLATACSNSPELDVVAQERPTTTAAEGSEQENDDAEQPPETISGPSIIEPTEYQCPNGALIDFDRFDLDRTIGPETTTLADGTERRSYGGWVADGELLFDAEPLQFQEKTALRVLNQATGEEWACPASGDAGLLSAGSTTPEIVSCSVSPPWGVMGGQQVTYLGIRGDVGTVEILRNSASVSSFLVGLTWSDLLTIRQSGLADEPVEDGIDPFGQPGEIFFSDFGSPSGEMSYDMVVRGPSGDEIQRVECGSVVVPSLDSITCSLDLLDGYPRITVSDGGFPQEVRRDGQPIELSMSVNGLIDTTASPDVPVQYEVTVLAPIAEVDPQVVQCGSITPVAIDLRQKIESAAGQIRAPHWYAEVLPICSECGLEPISLGWNTSETFQWIDGAFSPLVVANELWYTSPGDVPQLLIDSIDAGLEVAAEFDGFELVQWSIDGDGARYRCLDADTAPVDIRTPYHQSTLDLCNGIVSE